MLYNLERKRKDADFTQRELAEILGVTERQYQRLEAGTSDGSIKVWKQLSKLFDTTIDYLLEQEVTNSYLQ